MDISRYLLAGAKIHGKFRPEAVKTSAHLKNRMLANTLEKKTPYESFFKKKLIPNDRDRVSFSIDITSVFSNFKNSHSKIIRSIELRRMYYVGVRQLRNVLDNMQQQ